MQPTLRLALVSLLAVAAGCPAVFGGGDDDCLTAYDEYPAAPAQLLRNPTTGVCEGFGGVTDPCAPQPAGGAPAEPVAYPDYGFCGGHCDGFDEATCHAADGCRAVYIPVQTCAGTDCVETLQFAACWQTAQSGPARGGDCATFDAHECSRHDDCSVVHENAVRALPGSWAPAATGTEFRSCMPEAPACGSGPGGGVALPPLRNPETGQCEQVGGPEPCNAFVPLPDWGYCDGYCETLDEASCHAADGCRGIYANVCPPWADCYSVQFAGCWATAQSGPVRGGACEGLSAYDCSRHDDCTAEHDRDWSTCPASQPFTTCDPPLASFLGCHAETAAPPPPPPSCGVITVERTCVETAGCEPLYQGSDCTCDATTGACTCATWTFLACQSAG
jgi:hypothetical protein